MAETTTIRIYETDKQRIKEMAEARNSSTKEVVADLLRDPGFVCPACGDPFDPAEVDPESIEEYGLLTTDMTNVVRGERDVKSFECPCCRERISPEDIETIDTNEKTGNSGVTRDDIGVTDEKEGAEFSTEEA
jgi:predicted RNA-binding Zn-ribbon protein involved in translation (DUF1610 family)